MSQTVAIVGRPNVGKSTFFNRMIGERKAIIDDMSGVTRDRIYGDVDWNGAHFHLIDTGGYVKITDDVFEKAIKEQVAIAIEEAEIILFMVDVTTGITNLDDDVAQLLRKSKKPVLLIVNKVDNTQRSFELAEFYSLGFEELFPVSSISGSGTGEILDSIVEKIKSAPNYRKEESEEDATYEYREDAEEETEENIEKSEPIIPKIAIVGQPNVGKSSLVNALMGEERNIVTDIAGTTRDAIYSHYKKFGKEFTIVDTAGIRRKTKVNENLEFYSVIRAINAIDEADIVLLMIDAQSGLEAQDMTLYRLIERRRKGVILVVNKWDTVEKETNTLRDYEEALKTKLAPFNDIPIVFTSVTEKQRIFQLTDIIFDVFENLHKKIPTRKLNDVLLPIIEKTPPPAYRTHFIHVKYITQLPARHPTFAFFSNYPKHIAENYKNFLNKQLRQHFDFKGVYITLLFKEK